MGIKGVDNERATELRSLAKVIELLDIIETAVKCGSLRLRFFFWKTKI